MDTLDWERLLCAKRPGLNAEGGVVLQTRAEQAPRTPAEADVQRVVFSAPFRRLEGKTQVHPFARVDYVHNRLTHSLEVAETGAGLAQAVMRRMALPEAWQRAATLHVRAACLGHDIGNPPYGHTGEYAIRFWAERRMDELRALLREDGASSENALEDLRKFDGNAQTFRLLANPAPRDSAYFRLTCASLGALVKYPYRACDTAKAKFSCFASEEPCFDAVMEALGLRVAPGVWERHPLSYLLEIADDLCYCVTDCEDAVTLGILDEATVREWFLELFGAEAERDAARALSIPHLRAKVIGHLMEGFAEELVSAFRAPATLPRLEATSPTWARLKKLKSSYSIVFDDQAKIRNDLQAQVIIGRTLDCFLQTLQHIRDPELSYGDALFVKYTFGEDFVRQHRHRPYAWWLYAMLDFVTGMTDAYLQRFARIL